MKTDSLILEKDYSIESTYLLKYKGLVLATFKGSDKADFLSKAQRLAKDHQKTLVLANSFNYDIYLVLNTLNKAYIIKDSDFVSASLDFNVEGPFRTVAEAQEHCYKLLGIEAVCYDTL